MLSYFKAAALDFLPVSASLPVGRRSPGRQFDAMAGSHIFTRPSNCFAVANDSSRPLPGCPPDKLMKRVTPYELNMLSTGHSVLQMCVRGRRWRLASAESEPPGSSQYDRLNRIGMIRTTIPKTHRLCFESANFAFFIVFPWNWSRVAAVCLTNYICKFTQRIQTGLVLKLFVFAISLKLAFCAAVNASPAPTALRLGSSRARKTFQSTHKWSKKSPGLAQTTSLL